MKYIYCENYEMLMKETKDIYKERERYPMYMDWKN